MRIAIANDSLMAVEALRRILTPIATYTLAWIARDGAEAIANAIADPPDLILMDLFMPQINGIEATRQIMQQAPCAILVVTATVSPHGAEVFDAMGWGALDAVSTPVLDSLNPTASGANLLAKIETIAKLVSKSPRHTPPPPRRSAFAKAQWPPIVAIGASTGGPQALKTFLSHLPHAFPAAIVIVQHIDAQFAPGLATWLNQQVALPVKLVQPGQPLEAGVALVAGTNEHLTLTANLTLTYTPEPRHLTYRPSVDVFFQSVAIHAPEGGVGLLLTGMGRDGAAGLLALRSAGWHTIAQDQSSCVIYGMPKAAIALGAATEVLPPEKMAYACRDRLQRQCNLS